jgi:hypothetical protein
MNYHNLEELKKLLAAKFSPEELCELLGLSTYALVECLSEYIEEHQDMLEEAVFD